MSVSEDTLQQVEDFVDVYDIQSKDKAVSFLTSIVSNSSLSPNEIDEEASIATAGGSGDAVSIMGFLVTNSNDETTYVSFDGSIGAVLTNTSKPKSSVQPLPRTNITSGDIICPACGNTLVEYALSDSLPGIESGVFNTFTATCNTCQSERPAYTLFAASGGTSPPLSALADVMKSYFAYVFILDSFPPDEFTNRISACQQVSRDAGWQWLPSPDEWVGFDIGVDKYPAVTEKQYMEFIQTYLSHTLSNVDGVSVVGANIDSSELNDGSGSVTWEIVIETRGESIQNKSERFMSVFDSWDNQNVTIEFFDSDSLADHAVKLSFPRFLVDSQ